jgi:hypothetical protein
VSVLEGRLKAQKFIVLGCRTEKLDFKFFSSTDMLD